MDVLGSSTTQSRFNSPDVGLVGYRSAEIGDLGVLAPPVRVGSLAPAPSARLAGRSATGRLVHWPDTQSNVPLCLTTIAAVAQWMGVLFPLTFDL
jgi:hypothetical protein